MERHNSAEVGSGKASSEETRGKWDVDYDDYTLRDEESEQRRANRPVASCDSKTNVGNVERVLSTAFGTVLSGGAFLSAGIRRAVMGVAGGALLLRGLTGKCSVYKALGMNSATNERDRMVIAETTVIDRSPEELYQFWRDVRNLRGILSQLESVEPLDRTTSRWRWNSPLGTLQWDAKITEEQDGNLIAWKSLPGSRIANSGTVQFLPFNGGGTQVNVHIQLESALGKVGSFFSKISGASPKRELADALHRFKQIMEAGEKATTQGQAHGPA